MSADTQIMILTTCSNSKIAGGTEEYDPDQALCAALPETTAHILLDARARALAFVRDDLGTRGDMPLREVRANQMLVQGPDLGGHEAGRYLPAVRRYDGRFWKELGDSPRREQLLRATRHRVLILSALYGLLTPLEMIQNYNVNLYDHARIRGLWQQNDQLTHILLTCMREWNVSLVLDLIGDPDYRHLIRWPKVAEQARVLTAQTERKGATGLPALGAFLREHILSRRPASPTGLREHTYYSVKDERITLTGLPSEDVPAPPNRPEMVPSTLPSSTLYTSPAEAAVYRAMSGQLSREWVVFHRMLWHGRVPQRRSLDGEADFVVAHPRRGILVIEVKGGEVRCDAVSNRWERCDRHGDWRSIDADPIMQARSGFYLMLRRLKEIMGLAISGVPMGYALAFPDMSLMGASLGPAMDPAIVMDKSHLQDIEGWICRALAHWAPERRANDRITAIAVDRLRELLVADFP